MASEVIKHVFGSETDTANAVFFFFMSAYRPKHFIPTGVNPPPSETLKEGWPAYSKYSSKVEKS